MKHKTNELADVSRSLQSLLILSTIKIGRTHRQRACDFFFFIQVKKEETENFVQARLRKLCPCDNSLFTSVVPWYNSTCFMFHVLTQSRKVYRPVVPSWPTPVYRRSTSTTRPSFFCFCFFFALFDGLILARRFLTTLVDLHRAAFTLTICLRAACRGTSLCSCRS